MKKILPLVLTIFSVLFSSFSFSGFKNYAAHTKAFIQGHVIIGLPIGYSYLYYTTEKMDPKQKKEIQSYIKKISPDFRDSRCWLHRLSDETSITLRNLDPAKNNPSLEGRQSLSHISLKKSIKIDSTQPQANIVYNKHIIAHELAHYKHHSYIHYVPLAFLFYNKEKHEIEADLESFKMMEQYDPKTLDFYLKSLGFSRISAPYLNAKETVFLWNWYKIARKRKEFNQNTFLTQYIEKRKSIKEKLATISKDQLADQTEKILSTIQLN